jgi:hypothetical protein
MIGEHEEKEKFSIDILAPGHDKRTQSEVYVRTRKAQLLITPRCWICQRTAEEVGQPLESHHMAVEWQFAKGNIDWEMVKKDFPHFAWDTFDPSADPYKFVDDMTVQGLILCKEHHTGKDTGIHFTPFPIWIMQRYLKDKTQWSPTIQVVHVED